MCIFQFWFPQGIYLGVRLLYHVVVLFLDFLRNPHAIFHSGCINLHADQQCKSIPFSAHPTSIYYRLFDEGHSDWCEVICHCNFDLHFLMMSDIEHLFMCLLAICMSSLEKCLFRSFPHFLIGLFFWY